ncbi:hypothetical protein TWF102_011353 [Orbilia oligospora]|uniref:Uncharacterized protein n=1 Tax=Orbilia oligospora TaxID=2813651 RepID=A0A7C8J8R8_ORBOL|nr:hypothetical protein TWF706_002457 [Orbilia oligospora]KAF3085578.1 hypothetical protein TWF102_011353 [Orbilia oligospora]KAF3092205.1 hypothetical protein TWF103_011334 [Orbilia oligospora]KAF3121754.1 hypothetical protein TWF594_003126 [Orbilia oligospora]
MAHLVSTGGYSTTLATQLAHGGPFVSVIDNGNDNGNALTDTFFLSSNGSAPILYSVYPGLFKNQKKVISPMVSVLQCRSFPGRMPSAKYEQTIVLRKAFLGYTGPGNSNVWEDLLGMSPNTGRCYGIDIRRAGTGFIRHKR